VKGPVRPRRPLAGCGLALALAIAAAGFARAAESGEAAPAKTRGLLEALDVRDAATLHEAVPVEMRDGTLLLASVIVPAGAAADAKFPTILIQTPYLATNEIQIPLETVVLRELIRKGYAVAIVNVRGTHWSEGEYRWMRGARNDGLDTLDWVTRQAWSNGKVGAIGCSSSGEVSIPLATSNPPALKAVVAMGAATGIGVIPGFADQGLFYTGGIPNFNWAWWYHGNGYHHHPKLPRDISQAERVALTRAFDSEARYSGEDLGWAGHLPSSEILDAIGSPQTEFNRLVRLKPSSPEWREYDFLVEGQSTTVPILHVDSWYDTLEAYGTARMYEYLAARSPHQYLLMGGSSHCRQGTETERTSVGERPIGNARFDWAGTVVKWFDHWLKDGGQGDLGMPKVQYYTIESDRWTSAPAWPVKATPRRMYLSSGGRANSLSGDGRLVDRTPGREPADTLVDDPLDPVPTHGGGCCSDVVARDQSAIEQRQDVLVYTSAPFDRPVEIAGYLSVTLHVSSSAVDGDVMVKLVDVYPDGKAYNLTDTAQRLRYRDGTSRESLMEPGKIYEVTLGQMVFATRFERGHRLRLEIAGTNFPQYERNLHSGGRNWDETRPQTARLTVHHDRAHASWLQIPVVESAR
jgi:putative CocE/NonD family hydrolase